MPWETASPQEVPAEQGRGRPPALKGRRVCSNQTAGRATLVRLTQKWGVFRVQESGSCWWQAECEGRGHLGRGGRCACAGGLRVGEGAGTSVELLHCLNQAEGVRAGWPLASQDLLWAVGRAGFLGRPCLVSCGASVSVQFKNT